MKYYTGDEGGLVKGISFPVPDISKHKHKLKRGESKKPGETPAGPQPVVTSLGDSKIDKEEAVQHMCWGNWEGKKHIIVARKNGKIQFISPDDGSIAKEIREEHVGVGEKKEGKFVGLFMNDSTLITCTDTGHLRYIPLTSESPHPALHLQLTSDLCRMRVHPIQNHIFAVGGKERELTVYDVTALNSGEASKALAPAMENGERSGHNRHKKEKKEDKGVIFRAKNVKNDFLDLRVPVWITDIEWLSEDATKLVVATRHHKIRVYDTKAARRPALDVEVGQHPITSLCVGRSADEVIISDTTSNVFAVDVQTGKIMSQYKGFAGSVTSLHVSPTVNLASPTTPSSFMLISVSLDRFLRVHEMISVHRRIEHKVYLKQRLSCVLVDEEDEELVEVKEESESEVDEEERELWEKMTMVEQNDEERKKRKKRRKVE
ncbi:WD40-repeat-containing domain protein [Jimgerdemannia flammicorona]|uniref:Ribosome biogenesis protein NSA1 n=1 Tax=Jimgerdemannia flammicorona TaxID=994334 RepID=A0A433CXF5_9FUNG|nr:WD40-repeat-containing domain protein [Jimgerdemannia flammicorona]